MVIMVMVMVVIMIKMMTVILIMIMIMIMIMTVTSRGLAGGFSHPAIPATPQMAAVVSPPAPPPGTQNWVILARAKETLEGPLGGETTDDRGERRDDGRERRQR